jgi:hypothetical protein
MPPRILGGHPKKIEKSLNFSQKSKIYLIIIAIGSIIFLINYPPLPL